MSDIVNARVESLIRTAGQLVDVMKREIELLRSMRAGEIGSLEADKNALLAVYEERIGELAAEPGMLNAIAPALRDELHEVSAEMETAMKESIVVLGAVKESHNRLMKAIIDAVTEQRTEATGYRADGTRHLPMSVGGADPLSLTFNRQL